MFVEKSKISYPITISSDIAFIKRQLSIDANDTVDDEYINGLLEAAIEITEGFINKDIAYTSNVLTIEDYDGSDIYVDEGNLKSIVNLVNYDSSTLITNYDLVNYYNGFTLTFETPLDAEKLILTFYTGYSDASELPKGLKQAILVKLADLYDTERNSYNYSGISNSTAWERLASQYKIY
jgi:hypothetical protein